MPENETKAKPAPAADDQKPRKRTPAMQQYHRFKEEHPNALLLFQMGDFYETFHQDAIELAETINITLTTRGKDGPDPIPLAGFPMKALDGYLSKLVKAGKRLVIVDQVEDPKTAKGVVKRDVTRIVSPGTLIEDNLLEATMANHIVALVPTKKAWGVAWIDVSAGAFFLCDADENELDALLCRIDPAEIIASDSLKGEQRDALFEIEKRLGTTLTPSADWRFNPPQALKALLDHFEIASLEGFGVENHDAPSVVAAGALLACVKDQQRAELSHLTKLEPYSLADTMRLDPATVSALEIVSTLRQGERKGTLFWALDACQTAMGSRILREWLLAPLRSVPQVRLRHAAVDELAYHSRRREMVRETLKGLGDLERLAGVLGCGRAKPRDLIALKNALARVPLLVNALSGVESSLLDEIQRRLDPVQEAHDLIEAAIVDEPPISLKDGGVIRDGFDPELDSARSMHSDGRNFIAEVQAEEQEKSGIPNLKVGYTSVFGYYLETSNANREKVPEHWIRKQTLKNSERYITPKLKEIEEKVLKASDSSASREAILFDQVREELATHAGRMIATARLIALVDVLAGFAELSVTRQWVRPEVSEGQDLALVDGRHPVLERVMAAGRVVPNDCELPPERPMMILTGPNMAGKSTYIRMVAALTLMAQVGCFVPAQSFKFGLVDRIFTRLGSADEIQKGNSTFMLEMIETANILNNATDKSLIVLDEVGRGTSTFDGVSIAWSISEHIAKNLKARTLFATHYHELTQLSALLPQIQNANVSVREWGEEIIFLHKIVEGSADRSYGIHVAQLAGLPASVVNRSKTILGRLEKESETLQQAIGDGPRLKRPKKVQLTLFSLGELEVNDALKALDVDSLPEAALRAEVARLKALAESEG